MTSLEKVKTLAAFMTATSVALAIGFEVGFVVGHPGPFITGTFQMNNSNINASLPSSNTQSQVFPCTEGYDSTRCIFNGASTTCEPGKYGNNCYRNSTGESWECYANKTAEHCEYSNRYANQTYSDCKRTCYTEDGRLLPWGHAGDAGCDANECYENDTWNNNTTWSG